MGYISSFSAPLQCAEAPDQNFNTTALLNTNLTGILIRGAQGAVSMSSGRINPKPNKSWWSQECSDAVKERNKAHRLLSRRPTRFNILFYQEAASNARATITEVKHQSKISFINTIKIGSKPEINLQDGLGVLDLLQGQNV